MMILFLNCVNSRRSSDMEKMAESKYGQNKENAVLEKCQKLGAAIVTFDLLKIKHFNVIDFEKLMTATTTIKGAAFILYNVARLQTLLATFDQQVAKGFYDPLPSFDQIDFALLKTEVCFLFIVLFLKYLSNLSQFLIAYNEIDCMILISISDA